MQGAHLQQSQLISKHFFSLRLLLVSALFALAHLLFIGALPLVVRGGSALLLLGLPGALSALALFSDEPRPLTRLFLAACGGVVVAVPLLLALHALPGPPPRWSVVAACDALSVVAAVSWLRQPAAPHAVRWRVPFAPIVLLILAYGSAMRLMHLGSSEFQGDEARAMLMATGVFDGQDTILLLHKKGPLEVLLPAGLLSLVGTINESIARLPFAIAAIGVLLGVFVLARDLFAARGEREAALIGMVVMALAAVDGYLVGFGRIVQYQSAVVLLHIGAVWCMWQFYSGAARPRRYLFAAALAVAVALLAHYDGMVVLPALVWLAVAGGGRRGWMWTTWLRMVGPAVAVAAALVASFYVPFVLNEHFQQTVHYLATRSGYDGTALSFYNNLPPYFVSVTLYNTTFQIVAIGVTLVIGMLVWLWLFVRPRWLGASGALMLVVGCALLLFMPDGFAAPVIGNWAVVAFGLPLAMLVLAPATPALLRMLLLWFGSGFVAMAFVIIHPNTHFYVMDVAAMLLASYAFVQALAWLRTRSWRWLQVPIVAGGAAILLLAVPYVYLMFIDQDTENWRDWPGDLPAIYMVGHIAKSPSGSGFGVPHTTGWKVIGALYAQGVLDGCYYSNEEELVTGWYTRGAYRCEHDPDYYFLAARALNPIGLDVKQIRKTYHPFGRVLVDGDMRIEIYSRKPPDHPTQTFALRTYSDNFDHWQQYDFSLWDALALPLPQHPTRHEWQHGPQLLGYDLGKSQLEIGQTAFVSLYWNISSQIARAYEVQLEVRDAQGRSVGDVQPFCYTQDGDWTQYTPSELGFAVTAGARMPPGTYTLHVALHARQGGAALPLLNSAPDATLGTITVLPVEHVNAQWALLDQPLIADFGPNLRLRSAARDTAESPGWLRYQLFWTTHDALKPGMMLFAHLLNANGDRVAQVDLPLASSPWKAQQLYTSMLALPLPSDLPAGDYRLYVGVYDPTNGQRLPLHADHPGDGAAGDDALLLATVHLP